MDRQATGNQYSGATYLFNHQVPVWLDGEHPIAHNKVIIIDGQTVITGSFNFTKQAENSNAENLVIMQGRLKIGAAYTANFDGHLEHSRKYEGPK
jgi:phosphatidylserine/phosphatidylglycerophosphate/cardiolipin synthase-like enzyme